MRSSRSSTAGQALLLVALGSTFLLAMGGLAIDASWTYLAKLHLDTAVEATALGLSRADEEDRQDVAHRLFEANVRRSVFGEGDGPRLVAIDWSGQPAEVRVEAEASVPTLFSRVFSTGEVRLRSSATARRRGGRVVFVFERARELADPRTWEAFERAAGLFASAVAPGVQLDVVSFGLDATVEEELSPASVESGAGGSNLALGLYRAHSLLARADPAASAIVFVTFSPPSAFSTGVAEVSDCEVGGFALFQPAPGLTYDVAGVHPGTGDPSDDMIDRCEAVRWAAMHQAVDVANQARAALGELRVYGIALGEDFETFELDALEDLTNAPEARYPDPYSEDAQGMFLWADGPDEVAAAFARVRTELSALGF